MKEWKAAKGEYPAAFINGPELYSWLRWYLDTWDDLRHGRKYDQGQPLGIPPSEILSHCELLRIEWQDVREDLLYFCGVLDDVYCAWAATKDEEKEKFLHERREELKEWEICN